MGYDFKKIQRIMSDQEFSKDEGLLFLEIVSLLEKTPALDALLDLLQKNPQLTKELIGSYREKQAAFALGDSALWEYVLRKEEALLRRVSG